MEEKLGGLNIRREWGDASGREMRDESGRDQGIEGGRGW